MKASNGWGRGCRAEGFSVEDTASSRNKPQTPTGEDMLYLKIQAYQALSSIQWVVSARDLDAQPDDDPLVLFSRGATPDSGRVDELDSLVLVAQQALQRAVQSHMLGRLQHQSAEE